MENDLVVVLTTIIMLCIFLCYYGMVFLYTMNIVQVVTW